MSPSVKARLPSFTSCSLPSLEFAAEVSDFSKGRDPWALMNPDEMAHLASLWARNPEFAAFHFNQGKFPIDYLKNEMFKALPAADTPAFAAFPAPVRNLIDEKRAPRPQWWFMAIHYAKRLQEAARLGVPNATKCRQNNIAAYRKRLDELAAKGRAGGLPPDNQSQKRRRDEARGGDRQDRD